MKAKLRDDADPIVAALAQLLQLTASSPSNVRANTIAGYFSSGQVMAIWLAGLRRLQTFSKESAKKPSVDLLKNLAVSGNEIGERKTRHSATSAVPWASWPLPTFRVAAMLAPHLPYSLGGGGERFGRFSPKRSRANSITEIAISKKKRRLRVLPRTGCRHR